MPEFHADDSFGTKHTWIYLVDCSCDYCIKMFGQHKPTVFAVCRTMDEAKMQAAYLNFVGGEIPPGHKIKLTAKQVEEIE